MAIHYHLKFGSIKGEAGASKHKDEIEVRSWGWGASNPSSIVGNSMNAGVVSMTDLHFTKHTDKSSPKLIEHLVTGKPEKEAILTCSKHTGQKTPEDFLTIKLKDVYITSYQTGGSDGEDMEMESVSLSYGSVNLDYKEIKPDGSMTSAGSVEWNLIKREQTA